MRRYIHTTVDGSLQDAGGHHNSALFVQWVRTVAPAWFMSPACRDFWPCVCPSLAFDDICCRQVPHTRRVAGGTQAKGH